MHSIVTLRLLADCSSNTYLFQLIKSLQLHQFPKQKTSTHINLGGAANWYSVSSVLLKKLGILHIIQPAKGFSSNPVYQCQPHSSKPLTLQM